MDYFPFYLTTDLAMMFLSTAWKVKILDYQFVCLMKMRFQFEGRRADGALCNKGKQLSQSWMTCLIVKAKTFLSRWYRLPDALASASASATALRARLTLNGLLQLRQILLETRTTHWSWTELINIIFEERKSQVDKFFCTNFFQTKSFFNQI